MNKGVVFSLNSSKTKGTSKTPIPKALLIEGMGLAGDAHAAGGLRQVSLLSIESIRKQQECARIKKQAALKAGDFAENITTEGVRLADLKIGDRLKVGGEALLEISQIGKECHTYCAIYRKTGDCIMPREGIFARIIKGGEVGTGDEIKVIVNV
ncbi:MAG: MOSC domain-containing protein [Candidatus Latescibacter sp.]|nr:MOSC domain-containing protein [Candidatus Latescibacter sp.]